MGMGWVGGVLVYRVLFGREGSLLHWLLPITWAAEYVILVGMVGGRVKVGLTRLCG
jgi:hypothetical protein